MAHAATLAAPHDAAHTDHPAHLQHHFVTSEQQFDAAKLGMWLFLVTEILTFGGMFVAYAIFRIWYPELWEASAVQLDTVMGAINTAVLLTSSLTVAWAIRGAQRDDQTVLFWNLVATVALAGVFMVIKYFEYTHKFDLGIFPGGNFVYPAGTELSLSGLQVAPEGAGHDGHGPGAHGLTDARSGLFFSIYYVMTGIHGLHVLIGMGLIGWLAVRAKRGHFSSAYYTPVENVGLFWHLVDLIWIFLFPLMYLIS